MMFIRYDTVYLGGDILGSSPTQVHGIAVMGRFNTHTHTMGAIVSVGSIVDSDGLLSTSITRYHKS